MDSEDGQRWRPRSPPAGRSSPTDCVEAGRKTGNDNQAPAESSSISVVTAELPELVPSVGTDPGASSLLRPLTPGVALKGAGEGPAGATAFGGRFPGTLTVTRSRSISFPWTF